MNEPVGKSAQIRLFNVKFSPNLGDGLLSECLEQALIDCGADRGTHSIDLAARSKYTTGSLDRSLKLRVVEALPGFIRPLAVRLPLAMLSHRTWAPHFAAGLDGGDCVVIGGGNLLADLDLNFPTKLSLAIHAANRASLPVLIYGCGVSSGWSRKGVSLLREALATGAVKSVFVRDSRSQGIWDELFGNQFDLPADIVRDPGLLASEVYPGAPAQAAGASALNKGKRATIGINITSQIAVRYHSDSMAPAPDELAQWYVALAGELLAQGHQVQIFTNGSPEDRVALAELQPRLARLDGAERVSYPDAATPTQLVEIIAGLSGLVAFRMHAIIAAYSFGVPFLALSWDPKLDSFVESVGQTSWLCRVTQTPAKDAADKLTEAMKTGIASDRRRQIVAEARQGVSKLYARITDALG